MKDLVDFLYEMGLMKETERSGWALVKARGESLADHSLRAAQLAWLLARVEGADADRACAMAVFHEIGECRVGDVHRVARRYVEKDEEGAVADQVRGLEGGGEVLRMWKETEEAGSPEGRVAKDADKLEMVLTAMELRELKGVRHLGPWMEKVREGLRTESGKELFDAITSTGPVEWWGKLPEL